MARNCRCKLEIWVRPGFFASLRRDGSVNFSSKIPNQDCMLYLRLFSWQLPNREAMIERGTRSHLETEPLALEKYVVREAWESTW